MSNGADEKKHQEDDEADLCEAGGSRSDPAEAENGGDQCDRQESKDPVQLAEILPPGAVIKTPRLPNGSGGLRKKKSPQSGLSWTERPTNCTHAATQKLGPCSSFMQANTDHSIGTRLGRRGERAFDDWLQKQLHEMYDSIAQEPLPHDLARLIDDTSKPASQ